MFFSKTEKGPYTYLTYTFQTCDLLQYQLMMINESEQKIFLKQSQEKDMKIEITSLVPIDIYFKSCETFERRKHILKQLLEYLRQSEDYLLDMNRIILDVSYVYVDVDDMSIKLIYIPLQSFEHNPHKKMRELLLNLILTIDIHIIESDERLRKMITYLQDVDFDMFVFESLLKTLKKKDQKKEDKWYKKFLYKEKDKPKEKTNNETILLDEEKKFPSLEFQDKTVIINKNSFLIGRSPQLVDYAMPEQLTLGRVHVEFVQEKDACYLVDINTKNGTFINGERLISQKKYPVNKGDTIELAGKKAILK